jgi:hypothetical protein
MAEPAQAELARLVGQKKRRKKFAHLTFSEGGVRMNMCYEHNAHDLTQLTLPSDSGLGSPPPDRCTFFFAAFFAAALNPRRGHAV